MDEDERTTKIIAVGISLLLLIVMIAIVIFSYTDTHPQVVITFECPCCRKKVEATFLRTSFIKEMNITMIHKCEKEIKIFYTGQSIQCKVEENKDAEK